MVIATQVQENKLWLSFLLNSPKNIVNRAYNIKLNGKILNDNELQWIIQIWEMYFVGVKICY